MVQAEPAAAFSDSRAIRPIKADLAGSRRSGANGPGAYGASGSRPTRTKDLPADFKRRRFFWANDRSAGYDASPACSIHQGLSLLAVQPEVSLREPTSLYPQHWRQRLPYGQRQIRRRRAKPVGSVDGADWTSGAFAASLRRGGGSVRGLGFRTGRRSDPHPKFRTGDPDDRTVQSSFRRRRSRAIRDRGATGSEIRNCPFIVRARYMRAASPGSTCARGRHRRPGLQPTSTARLDVACRRPAVAIQVAATSDRAGLLMGTSGRTSPSRPPRRAPRRNGAESPGGRACCCSYLRWLTPISVAACRHQITNGKARSRLDVGRSEGHLVSDRPRCQSRIEGLFCTAPCERMASVSYSAIIRIRGLEFRGRLMRSGFARRSQPLCFRDSDKTGPDGDRPDDGDRGPGYPTFFT